MGDGLVTHLYTGVRFPPSPPISFIVCFSATVLRFLVSVFLKTLKKLYQLLITTPLFLGVFFFGISSSSGSYILDSHLVVTEIHPEEEYIEMQNISDETLNLSGYKYSEETGSGIEKFYEFPLANILLLPGDFFVIDLSRKINNSGDVIRIYTPKEDKIAEISVPKSEQGKSYSLIGSQWSWENPTKALENSTLLHDEYLEPSLPVSSLLNSELFISEILPNPVGIDTELEFIELYNASEDSVSLDIFYIEDTSGKKFFLSNLENSQKILAGNSYFALPYSQTKITINNSNEAIFLKNSGINADTLGHIISEVKFSGSAREGESLAKFEEGYVWTTSPTKGLKNILTLSEEKLSSNDPSGISKKVYLFDRDENKNKNKNKKNIESLENSNIVLKIQKIFPSSRPDRIDVLCVQCDASLEGIRLGVDGEIFRISDVFGKTGDVLSFEFENITISEKKKRRISGFDSKKKNEKTKNGWKFFVPVSGLTSTDETVYIGNRNGKILDAVFYSNKNNLFPSSEKEVLLEIITHGEWAGKAREFYGVSTVAMNSQSFLKRRINDQKTEILEDTNSQDDFFRGFLTDDITFNFAKNENKKNDVLRFSEFIFSPKKITFSIENISKNSVLLSDYYLTNKEMFLVRLDEERKFLFPNQKILITFPEKKIKKLRKGKLWKNSDIFLEIRDRNDFISDVFCFEPLKKSGKFRSNRYHRNLLKTPLLKGCFSVSPENSSQKRRGIEKKREQIRESELETANLIFRRIHNAFPISKNSYSRKIEILSLNKRKDMNNMNNKNNRLEDMRSDSLEFKKFPEILLRDNELFLETPFSTEELHRKKMQKILDIKKKFPIIFSRVLPNPKGKDSLVGAEEIFLKNTSSDFVFLRNFSIKTDTRKTGKKLPFLLFAPHQERKILFFSGFSLKNSDNSVALISSENIVIDTVSWKKAREGEFFGAFAPHYREKKVMKKLAKKSSKPLSQESSREEVALVPKPLEHLVFKSASALQNKEIVFFLLFFFVFSGIFGGIGFYLYTLVRKKYS